MPYPAHTTYERLYARYLVGARTAQLLDLAGPLQDKTVADLCGGGGRLARAARERGAKVTLVDESRPMTQDESPGIALVRRDIHSWLTSFCDEGVFDGLFCQQAVNYWLTPELASELAAVLKPGGFFIFNTFNRPPARVPTIKQYVLDGVSFAEASWLTGSDTVEHVQMREGEPAHVTQFRWITSQQYRDWLGGRFDLEEHVSGPASVWVCRRKAD